MSNNTPRATIDFETRSECSIRQCGSWRYSLDPTTEILCLAFRLPTWERGRTSLWHPGFPQLGITEDGNWDELTELYQWVIDGNLIEAHNAWFERGVWNNIFKGPHIHPLQWRCSAAKAAAHALPRALDDALSALNLSVRKDAEGEKLMKKITKPRKAIKRDIQAWGVQHAPCGVCATKGKIKIGRAKATLCEACNGKGWYGEVPPLPTLWYESREQFEQLWAYCRQDVLAEEALSEYLRDLSPDETDIYTMDQMVNERGFALDTEAVDVALELIDIECVDLNAELAQLTEGTVEKATQRARMLEWFEANGLYLTDTQADTLDDVLTNRTDLPAHVLRGVELMKTLGRSSTAKYVAMNNWVCPDGRVHGGLLYHGAATGRWSGSGVQPHNFVRGKIADMELAWDIIKTKNRALIQSDVVDNKGVPIGSVMDVLAHALRGAIIPSPGKELFVADYAAIEARVVMWLANDQQALDIFRRHEDIYCFMASDIYGYPCNKKDHPDERQMGKQAILGLGYQMGWRKFRDTCASFGITIDDHLAQRVVDTYREKFWRIKDLWTRQENCAMEAVYYPEDALEADGVRWEVEGRFLYCTLPSGRSLAYADPEIREYEMPWGVRKDCLTFKGINSINHQWQRQKTYGGSLVENIVQAIARDLMAAAMWRCEQSKIYTPVLSVHDEMIAEADIGQGNVKEFEHLMAENPVWAKGLPVEAEGWSGFRYRK